MSMKIFLEFVGVYALVVIALTLLVVYVRWMVRRPDRREHRLAMAMNGDETRAFACGCGFGQPRGLKMMELIEHIEEMES